MPGIDDVDRQFRRVATAPTDGELAAERGGTQPCTQAQWERYLAERGLLPGPALVDRVQPISQGTLDALDVADRREVRRQALVCACQCMAAQAGFTDPLRLARHFEAYLLGEGDDPSVPKPPAKME